jgi:SAM-dependent methyltransferase
VNAETKNELPPYPAKLYRALHTGNPGDLEFYRARCAEARSVIELGCGDARILAGLDSPSLERLVGLELHAELLDHARQRIAKRAPGAAPIELVEADMMAPPDLGTFDRVIVPHGSLYCLLEPEQLALTLSAARRLLEGDGALLFDVWAADDFHEAHDPAEQADSWVDHLGRFDIDGEDWEIIERSRWSPAQQRIDVSYTHVQVGHTDGVEALLPQRYFLHDEIVTALGEAGFSRIRSWGGFADEPFGPDAELLVVEARP